MKARYVLNVNVDLLVPFTYHTGTTTFGGLGGKEANLGGLVEEAGTDTADIGRHDDRGLYAVADGEDGEACIVLTVGTNGVEVGLEDGDFVVVVGADHGLLFEGGVGEVS